MKIKIITLILITLFLGYGVTSSLQAGQIIDDFVYNITKQKSDNHHRIFGIGICYGIGINGDIKQGKGRNRHLTGFLQADLSIRNQDPIFLIKIDSVFPYILRIKNLQTGKILTKDTLPVYVYLKNFSGLVYINDYYIPWGPTHAKYFLFGKAEYLN